MAEGEILATILREPAMLDQAEALTEEQFSSPLLGKVYGQLRKRHDEGREVSTAVLEDLATDEISHIALIVQRQQNPINEQAFADCIRIVCREYQASQVKDEKDLQAFAKRMRERKGMK
jgi:DNA primase